MKKILSVLIIVVSIILGIYVGIWLMLAGGIMQIVNSINPLDGMGIAIGVIRIIFCEIGAIFPCLGIVIAGFINID